MGGDGRGHTRDLYRVFHAGWSPLASWQRGAVWPDPTDADRSHVFFLCFWQGDEERAMGHTPNPMMDRLTAVVPQQQLGFIGPCGSTVVGRGLDERVLTL